MHFSRLELTHYLGSSLANPSSVNVKLVTIVVGGTSPQVAKNVHEAMANIVAFHRHFFAPVARITFGTQPLVNLESSTFGRSVVKMTARKVTGNLVVVGLSGALFSTHDSRL